MGDLLRGSKGDVDVSRRHVGTYFESGHAFRDRDRPFRINLFVTVTAKSVAQSNIEPVSTLRL